ncbi:MAG: hypothetical protein K6T28_08910 [Acidothermus sp.]|nr:hypothetical protein [Acidothermus sp.]
MSRLRLTAPMLAIALLVSYPALRGGLFDHSISIAEMFIRLGVAVVLVMVARALLDSVIDTYRYQNLMRRRREEAARRSTDDAPQPR